MAVTYIAPAATHIFGVFYAKGATVDVSTWPDRAISEALDRGWITPQSGVPVELDPVAEGDLATHKASADHDSRYDSTGAAATVNTALTTHKTSVDHDSHNDGRYDATGTAATVNTALTTHKASADHDTHNDGRYDATGAAATVNTALTTHKSSADHDSHNDGRYGKILEGVNTVGTSGGAQTLPDVTSATMHKITLTANCTITVPAPGTGKSFTVELVQDATGGRSVTWVTPSGAIRWPHGTPPVITGTANAIDVVTFLCIGGTNWYAFVAGQAMA